MVGIGTNCLLNNTDLKEKIKELIPILNLQVGARNGKPTFRQVYKELIKETGVELDLDSFAEMYKSEIPADLRFTTDTQVEDILNVRTKAAFERLANGTADRLDGAGETSTDRAAINKAAGILTTIEGKDKSVKTKTLGKIVKDAVLAGIQRLANSNEAYKELRTRGAKETFDETMQRVLEISSLSTQQIEADKFNTIQDVMQQARSKVLESMKDLRDEDGEFILGEEGLNFLQQYQDAVFGVMMSTGDANTIIRGALLEAGFGKGPSGKQVVDWKKLAGEINSPETLRENVVKALQEGKGLTKEAAESIAAALTNEFADLVQGQKAMNVKYSLAETEAQDILNRLGKPPSETLTNAINTALREAIDNSVAESDTLNISEIVHDVMRDVARLSESQLANLPKRGLTITTHTADRIAKLVKGDGLLDDDALAELYGILGKYVDDAVIADLRRLSKLKEAIESTEIIVDDATGKVSLSKQGLEKAKLIQKISDDMARIVARSADYSDKSLFYKFTTYALNTLSKVTSISASLVLVNPFNLVQNLTSGRFVSANANIGNKLADSFGKSKTPLYYEPKGEDGNPVKDKDGKVVKVNLDELLNSVTIGETLWNTFLGARGRDIPDLFTGDVSKETKTFQSAETKGEYVEAALSAIPRLALTSTDAMLKEPFYRQELIRGILYYLQASGGKTKQEALDLVYKALTENSIENLMKQAKNLATMVGKGQDKYYIKQVAEDIQLSSLVLMEVGSDGVSRSLLSEDNLKAIMDAAKQTSSESFGHVIQKDVWGLPWVFKILTGGKAFAIESLNREHGNKMAELYKVGKYREAAWEHFKHTTLTTTAFLFQRGIYNWGVLISQRNPLSIARGFQMLAKTGAIFHKPEDTQAAVENYLRARSKIGRGISGTAVAAVTVPLVMAVLGGGDDDERRKRLAALRADPVWGRLYRNFVNPFAQAWVDMNIAEGIMEGVATGLKDMAIQPVVSAGSKYFSADALLIKSVENASKGKFEISGRDFGQASSIFLPGKGFLNTNKAWVERMGKDAPALVDENWQIVADDRKKPKKEDFWDAFWYSSVFKNYKKK